MDEGVDVFETAGNKREYLLTRALTVQLVLSSSSFRHTNLPMALSPLLPSGTLSTSV